MDEVIIEFKAALYKSLLFARLISIVVLIRLRRKQDKGKRRKRKDCGKKRNSGKQC